VAEKLYIIGIRDNGIPAGISASELEESLSFMSNIVGIINATITGIRVYEANSGVIATIRIIKDISQLQELTI
jgi:GTPase